MLHLYRNFQVQLDKIYNSGWVSIRFLLMYITGFLVTIMQSNCPTVFEWIAPVNYIRPQVR